MERPDDIAFSLLWKFMTTERRGFIRWHWEVWTPGGHFVQRSAEDYETLTDCEANARTAGWRPD